MGAKSVVAKRFNEPNCAICGNPAKVVKTGINFDVANVFENAEDTVADFESKLKVNTKLVVLKKMGIAKTILRENREKQVITF